MNSSRWVLFFLVTLALGDALWAQDEAIEAKLHRKWQSFASQPTSEQAWSQASGRKAPGQTYNIQRGDTLSELSGVLFGDPGFWPKIWSLNNRAIENPHIILPGQTLEFFVGSEAGAPSFRVLGVKEQRLAMKSDPLDIEWDFSFTVPAATKKANQVTEAPRSFPAWSYGETQPPRQKDFELESFDLKVSEPETVVPYIISRQPLVSIGAVSGWQKNAVQLFVGEKVRIDSASLGEATKIHFLGRSQSTEVPRELKNLLLYPVVGEAERQPDGSFIVTEFLNSSLGDELIVQEGPAPRFNVLGTQDAGAAARVVSTRYRALASQMFGPGQYLVLQLQDGAGAVNDRLSLTGKQGIPKGEVVVSFVSGDVAIARVIQASEELRPGDTTKP